MPWTTTELETLAAKAKVLVIDEFKDFSSLKDCPVFIASAEEMQDAILEELVQLNYSKEAIKKIQDYYLKFVIGKYFKLTSEIWLLHGKGDNMITIVHELLHSIQQCEPNREGIVDFLTYKITTESQYIDNYELADWQEIEETHSYKKIKTRLVSKGDCEDF